MTKQEMFERVVRGLAAQGWERSVDPDDEDPDDGLLCLYRGPGGRKCAAGHLIADEHYRSFLEDCGSVWPEGAVAEALIASGVPKELLDVVAELQQIHDCGVLPGGMHASFRRFAKYYDLTWPEGC